MNCREARAGILEGDPSTLAGQSADPLALHIQGCPQCRDAAAVVLQGQAALGAALEASVPDPDLDAALEWATAGRPGAQEIRRGRIRSGRWWKWASLPLAAAAAALVLLFPGDPSIPGDTDGSARVAEGLELEVPEGTNVAVLETNNPDITVLWFF